MTTERYVVKQIVVHVWGIHFGCSVLVALSWAAWLCGGMLMGFVEPGAVLRIQVYAVLDLSGVHLGFSVFFSLDEVGAG